MAVWVGDCVSRLSMNIRVRGSVNVSVSLSLSLRVSVKSLSWNASVKFSVRVQHVSVNGRVKLNGKV